MERADVKLAEPEFAKRCVETFTAYVTGRLKKADFDDAVYLLQTAANAADRNALEAPSLLILPPPPGPTPELNYDESEPLRYASRV